MHLYVTRDKDGIWGKQQVRLWKNKPIRGDYRWLDETTKRNDSSFPIGKDVYANLDWEDEPLKVRIITEDALYNLIASAIEINTHFN